MSQVSTLRMRFWILFCASLFSPAAHAAGSWQIEHVDRSSAPGRFSSLKIDSAGNVHVAYVIDDDGHALKYAFWDQFARRWFTMTVAGGASYCDLALDSKQRPHISYADFGTVSGARLRHVFWDGAAWQNTAIPLNSDVIGYYTSIVLDSNDYPSISFYEYRGPKGTDISVRMRTVTFNGKYWEARTVDGDNQSGKFNAMAMDRLGRRHLAYANVNTLTAGVRYAFWDGALSPIEIVEDRQQTGNELVGFSVGMAVDKDGDPHLTYVNYSHPAAKYAVRKAGRWRVETIEPMRQTAYPDRNSIAIDPDGNPYVGYFDPGRGVLRLAHRDRQKWLVETVDDNGSGFASSMQIDRGVIWMSYGDEANGGLKVARRELGSAGVNATHVSTAANPDVR